MQTGYSELLKAFEASVFAISLILLALAQTPVNSTRQPAHKTGTPVEIVPVQP